LAPKTLDKIHYCPTKNIPIRQALNIRTRRINLKSETNEQ